MPTLAENIHGTAQARRRIAIDALGRELDGSNPASAASRLANLVETSQRPMLVSADIDGLVSASMLASVAKDWDIVAFVAQSQKLYIHPDFVDERPADIFGIDVFSPRFDNVSNHVALFGSKQIQITEVRTAFTEWDELVVSSGAARLLAVPSIWAGTEASYEGSDRPTSAKYKYPLGTAQVLLALLEAGGHAPRFYDRHFLPWLVANCDGGVSTYSEHAYNAGIWWSTLAGAVGPASLTEQVYARVSGMRPHDFIDAVNRLDRERAAQTAWLDDKWNLVDQSRETLGRTLRWIDELTGWGDPLHGGLDGFPDWVEVAVLPNQKGEVYIGGPKYREITSQDPAGAAQLISDAEYAVNANFYFGGFSGSRFNWVGGW